MGIIRSQLLKIVFNPSTQEWQARPRKYGLQRNFTNTGNHLAFISVGAGESFYTTGFSLFVFWVFCGIEGL